MSQQNKPGGVRLYQNNFPVSPEPEWTWAAVALSQWAKKTVSSGFFLTISFINCVSKQANWNPVKLFILQLIFSLLAQVQETKSSCQRADCTAKRCRLKCHLSTVSGDLLPHCLFISFVATWVFVPNPYCVWQTEPVWCFQIQHLEFLAISPQLIVAKRMCFPPLPNKKLKIWFRAFINGITLRSAWSIYLNWGILVNPIHSDPQIFLGAHLIPERSLMANRAAAYARGQNEVGVRALKSPLFSPVIS